MTSSSEGVDSTEVAIIIGIICVVSVFSNTIVIYITWSKPANRRSATNIFIVNLAVSDIILGGVTLPLILLDAYFPELETSNAECKFKMALPLFNVFSSVCTMVLMSVDRLYVVVYGKIITSFHARLAVFFVWVASLVLTAPQFYEYRVMEKWEEEENETELACSSAGRDPAFLKTYAILVLVVAYLLPLAFLIKNYVHIIVFVVKKAGQIEGQISRAKVSILRIVIIIAIVFVFLWLPFFVYFTIEEITGTDDSSQFTTTPHIIKQIFVALSTLSNPVIYFSLMQDYRQACKRLLVPRACLSFQVQPSESLDTGRAQTEPPRRPPVFSCSSAVEIVSDSRSRSLQPRSALV